MYELPLGSLSFLVYLYVFMMCIPLNTFDDRSLTWVGKEISRPLSMLLFSFTAVLDKKVKTWSHSS